MPIKLAKRLNNVEPKMSLIFHHGVRFYIICASITTINFRVDRYWVSPRYCSMYQNISCEIEQWRWSTFTISGATDNTCLNCGPYLDEPLAIYSWTAWYTMEPVNSASEGLVSIIIHSCFNMNWILYILLVRVCIWSAIFHLSVTIHSSHACVSRGVSNWIFRDNRDIIFQCHAYLRGINSRLIYAIGWWTRRYITSKRYYAMVFYYQLT